MNGLEPDEGALNCYEYTNVPRKSRHSGHTEELSKYEEGLVSFLIFRRMGMWKQGGGDVVGCGVFSSLAVDAASGPFVDVIFRAIGPDLAQTKDVANNCSSKLRALYT